MTTRSCVGDDRVVMTPPHTHTHTNPFVSCLAGDAVVSPEEHGFGFASA